LDIFTQLESIEFHFELPCFDNSRYQTACKVVSLRVAGELHRPFSGTEPTISFHDIGQQRFSASPLAHSVVLRKKDGCRGDLVRTVT
jgi:hypothetical protein